MTTWKWCKYSNKTDQIDESNRETYLTLNDPYISKIFIFTLLCGASKGFMKVFKYLYVRDWDGKG